MIVPTAAVPMSSVSPLAKPVTLIPRLSNAPESSFSRSAVPLKSTVDVDVRLFSSSVPWLSSVKLLPISVAPIRADPSLRTTLPPWNVAPGAPMTSIVPPLRTSITPLLASVPT